MDLAELKERKVGILMGGISDERDISLKSGNAVLKALSKSNYNVMPIDVDRDVALRISEEKIDVAFIALHGRYGEDGCIQGLLELMDVPYTGSGVTSSAIAMDKVATKKVLVYHGIQVPAFKVVNASEVPSLRSLKMPVVVKPVAQGSTIGVSVVEDYSDLQRAIDHTFEYGQTALIERFIDGREFTVGILNGRPLPVIEICSSRRIYDFEAKYTTGNTDCIVPAELSREDEEGIRGIALESYGAVGCRGAARVDLIMDGCGAVNVLEVNTVPGLTETSLLPMAAASGGMGFSRLIEEILFGVFNC